MSFVHSIKFRFTLWYLVVLVILLLSLSIGVYFYLSRSLYQNLDDSLQSRAYQLKDIATIYDSIRQGEFQEELGEVVMLCFYTEGQLMKVSPRNWPIPLSDEFVKQVIAGENTFTTIEVASGEELRFLGVQLIPEGPIEVPRRPGESPHLLENQPLALIIGRSTQEIGESLDWLVTTFIIVIPLALAVAASGGAFLARRALKPIDKISQTARQIEESDLSRRIEVDTKDELGRLASILNQMIDRLERAFKRQQQFTSDASHELRAPLAVIQAESSLALQKDRNASDYRQSLETVSQETGHMTKIIDQLLTLARADAGKEQFSFDEVNLSELLGDLSSDVMVLCQDKGLEFQLNQIDGLVVRGDRSRLRRLFLNILNNSIRYTPGGGTINVSLRKEETMAVVSISDTGTGIPPEDIPHIFERFYRVDKARSRDEGGSGLGLAICQHIAEVHGGKIVVESQVGIGSTFNTRLPLDL